MKITRAHRLDAHFAVCAATTALPTLLGTDQANAAFVYSGIVNITIPGNFAGVYLNLVTGLTSTSAGTNPGHDFNPYYGGQRLFMNNALGNNAVGTGTAATNMPRGGFFGALVGPGSPFITSTNFPTMENFVPGVSAMVGLRFRRESDSMVLYGWVRIIKSSANNLPGTIVDYMYEDSGNPTPAPGSLALLALGAMGLSRRRRKA